MKKLLILTALLTCLFTPLLAQNSTATQAKPRTIITTDGEVDDVDTFVRMLLYSNEYDVVGLVYSSSQWHYKGDGKGTKFTSEMDNTAKRYGERTELRWPGTTWMEAYIDKYAAVYPNLTKHAKGYPTPERLKSLIRVSNIDFEGDMSRDTDRCHGWSDHSPDSGSSRQRNTEPDPLSTRDCHGC